MTIRAPGGLDFWGNTAQTIPTSVIDSGATIELADSASVMVIRLKRRGLFLKVHLR